MLMSKRLKAVKSDEKSMIIKGCVAKKQVES